jgi:hypothetical protein
MGAAGVLALGVFASLMAPDMGLGLVPPDPIVPLDPAVRLLVGPGLGAPGGPGWLGSSLLARLALLLPLGSASARLAVLALAAGVMAALLTFAFYRRLSLTRPSALLGSVVAATGPTTLALVTTGSVDALLVPLVPGLLLCSLWWTDTGRLSALCALSALMAVAVGSYPALSVMCAAAALCLTRPDSGVRSRRLLPVALVAMAVGALHRAVAAGLTWRVATDALAGPAGDPAAAWSWTVPFGALRADGLANRLATLASATVGELGLPAGLLAMVAVVLLARRADGRSLVWAWVASLVALAVWIPSTSSDGVRVVTVLSWLLAGVGLDWIWRSSEGWRAHISAVTVAVFLVVAGTSTLKSTRPWHAGLAATTHVDRLLADETVDRPIVVAERPTLHRAHASDPSRRMTRVSLAGPAVKPLHDAGRPLLAFARARGVLEHLGGQFQTVPVRAQDVSLPQLLAALPRGSIVAAAGGPGLSYALSPDMDPLFASIGGSTELFGQSPGFYAVVGVSRRGGPALEQYSTEATAIDLTVGDEVGGFPVRMMTALRVVSDRSGAQVELNREVVARSTAGLALIATTPDGQLLIALGDELDDGDQVMLSGVDPPVSRLIGWEPCLTLPVGEWVDVRAAALAGGVAGSLRASGDRLTLYATARRDRPVGLWPSAPGGAGPDTATVQARYRLASEEDQAELQRQLGGDQPPQDVDWSAVAVVQRVQVARRGAIAVEFGEVPTQAYARYESAEPTDAGLELCGALSGTPRFVAEGPSVATVELAQLDTIGWGWHDLEGEGRGSWRWSDGAEGGLLLQLNRRGQIRVEVDASAVAADLGEDDVTITLLVNGRAVADHPMAGGTQTYQWLVPATRWKTGMNRVGLRVSSAVTPAAIGTSDDQRSLGLALRRLDLALVDPLP